MNGKQNQNWREKTRNKLSLMQSFIYLNARSLLFFSLPHAASKCNPDRKSGALWNEVSERRGKKCLAARKKYFHSAGKWNNVDVLIKVWYDDITRVPHSLWIKYSPPLAFVCGSGGWGSTDPLMEIRWRRFKLKNRRGGSREREDEKLGHIGRKSNEIHYEKS